MYSPHKGLQRNLFVAKPFHTSTQKNNTMKNNTLSEQIEQTKDEALRIGRIMHETQNAIAYGEANPCEVSKEEIQAFKLKLSMAEKSMRKIMSHYDTLLRL
mgnify:CR=1 FL=1